MQVPILTVYRAGKAVDIDPAALDLWTGNGWGLKPAAPGVEPVAVAVELAPVQVETVTRAGRRGK